MEASAVEAGHLSGELSLGSKPWYDLRPVFIISAYSLLFLALDWGSKALGLPDGINHGCLTAGLHYALLIIFGISYAPAVFLAGMADILWLHPDKGSMALATLVCLGMTVNHLVAAAVLRRMASGSRVGLECGAEVLKFMLTSLLSCIALAMFSLSNRLLTGEIQTERLLEDFQVNFLSSATSIFAFTPFLLIQAGPWIDTFLLGINGERPAPSRYLQTLSIGRPATMFALFFGGMAAAALWLLYTGTATTAVHLFLLFSIPLIWVAIKQGLEGLSVAVPILLAVKIVAIWHLGAGADITGLTQTILLASTLNAYLIGTGVTESRIANRQMERRDAILDAVSYAAQQFLGKSGWETGVQEVMRRLGEATAVTRVFITDKRRPDKSGKTAETWLYEWTTPGLQTAENDRRMLNLLHGQLIEDMAEKLDLGQPYLYRTKEIVRNKRKMLEALGVRSVVIVPMFVDRQWWGCLGLEQCFVERDWPVSEIDGLKMAGQILGTLIASVRVEQQFRQLTGNIQAVFWISSPDGCAKEYVSPGYEEVWGRSCTTLQREPRSWLDGIHNDDRSRVHESLVKQGWGEFDEEYRVLRPDGSMRWVRDRAFPVRDQTGQVYRIVGIAEDITKQKRAEEQLRAASGMLSSLIDHLQSGVVVEDVSRRITHVNQAFASMFDIPVPPPSLFGVDSRLLFLQPASFAKRIEEIIKAGTPLLGEELPWRDRVFVRNYVPLHVGEDYHYHLWQYQDITESRHAEEQIKTSLKEKEVLLKEIHHRVKNNLQIICSLLRLQTGEIEDPKAIQAFRESQDRVKAMALIHERLYQARDLARIDFAGYVRNLTGHLVRSYKVNSSAIQLSLEIDSIPVNLDVAIPCGLIINELVSNALKYAFPNEKGGNIRVCFAAESEHARRLIVSDNGVGLAENVNPQKTESLGLSLVQSLTEQLGGTITFCNQNGFHCDISIPHTKCAEIANGATA